MREEKERMSIYVVEKLWRGGGKMRVILPKVSVGCGYLRIGYFNSMFHLLGMSLQGYPVDFSLS